MGNSLKITTMEAMVNLGNNDINVVIQFKNMSKEIASFDVHEATDLNKFNKLISAIHEKSAFYKCIISKK